MSDGTQMPKQRRRRKSHLERRLNSTGDLLTQVVQYGLIALLILFPMARGGREPWAFPIVVAFVVFLFCCWIVIGCLQGEFYVFKAHHLVFPVGLVVIGILQLLIAEKVVTAVAGANARCWDSARAAGFTDFESRISLAPDHTENAIIWLVFITTVAFLMVNVFRCRKGVMTLTVGLVIMAVTQALAGFWPMIMDSPNWYSHGGVSRVVNGTFPNRNHFACMMGIGIILSIAMAVLNTRTRRISTKTPARSTPSMALTAPMVLLLFPALLVMGTGQILSQSRGGTVTTALGLCVLGYYAVIKLGRKWKGYAWGIAGVAIVLTGAGEGVARLSGRYGQLISVGNIGIIGRVAIWKDTLRMISGHWTTGVGLGSFEVASLRYETGFSPDRIAVHAHNDWLELIAEIGVPLGVIFIVAAICFLVSCWRCVIGRRDPILKWLGIGAATSCSAIVLHALVEFNFHIPALAVATMGVVTVLFLCCKLPSNDDIVGESICWRIRPPKALRYGLSMLAIMSAGIVVYRCIPYISAGLAESKLRLMAAPAMIKASRMKPEARSRFCVELCDAILAVRPNDAYVLRQKADHETYLLRRIMERGEPDLTAKSVVEKLAAIAKMMSTACRPLPTHGHYQAMCAMAYEQLGRFGEGIDEERLTSMYRLAHQNSPNLGYVTYLCANGAWRRYQRSTFNGDEIDESAKKSALALYRETIRQSPRRSTHIFARVWASIPEPDTIRALLSNRLVVHEQLFQFFLEKGLYRECLTQLDLIKSLNENRKTIDDRGSLSAYDMGRISSLSRDEVAVSVGKRQALVMGMLGEWSKRDAVIDRFRENLQVALEPKLNEARRLMNTGQSIRAGVLLHDILNSEPRYADAVIEYARHLRVSGQYSECANALATIVYQPDPTLVELSDLKKAMVIVDELQKHFGSSQDQFPVHSFVQQGLRVLIGQRQKDDALLHQAREQLITLSDGLFSGAYQWMQEPMVHYYLGQCFEALNEQSKAVEIYCRNVSKFQAHWYSYSRLLDLARDGKHAMPETVLAQARSLYAHLNESMPINTHFGGKLVLMGSVCDTPRATRGDRIEIRHHFLCVGNVTRAYEIYVQFSSRGVPTFYHRVRPNSSFGRGTLGWRVGEVRTVEQLLNPARLAAESATMLRPGHVGMDIHIVELGKVQPALIPMIPARLPAFELIDDAMINPTQP